MGISLSRKVSVYLSEIGLADRVETILFRAGPATMQGVARLIESPPIGEYVDALHDGPRLSAESPARCPAPAAWYEVFAHRESMRGALPEA